MPRHYIRKSDRAKSYSQEQMQGAVAACTNGEMGLRCASKQFCVPKSTLADKVKQAKNGDAISVRLGRRPILPLECEAELARFILDMKDGGVVLFKKDIRELAYEFAVRNHLRHDFNDQTRMAGRFWLQGFLKRYPNIAPLSKSQVFGKNHQEMGQYFGFFGDIMGHERLHQATEMLYDGETRLPLPMINQHVVVLDQEGKKSVVTIIDNEKGQQTMWASYMKRELRKPLFCKYCLRSFHDRNRWLTHLRHHKIKIRPYWYRGKANGVLEQNAVVTVQYTSLAKDLKNPVMLA